jgi:hypothetical protein
MSDTHDIIQWCDACKAHQLHRVSVSEVVENLTKGWDAYATCHECSSVVELDDKGSIQVLAISIIEMKNS